jgi:carboxymethylenebutenolidase
MDGIGIRPTLYAMCERLAGHGYFVLLPNLYYRLGPAKQVKDVAKLLAGDSEERDAMMQRFQSINHTLIGEDTGTFLAVLDGQPKAKAAKVGCVGYCMGGGFALTAAGTYPDRIAAAASLHGAHLAVDAADSPHHKADRMKGRIYVGVSETDPYLAPGETERLKAALDAAHVRNQVEIYPGVVHGFAVDDVPVYDRPAAEKHWERILALFRETLG